MSLMRRCDGVTRRNAVQVGLGGMLGTGLASGLRAMAESRVWWTCGEGDQLYSDLDGWWSDAF